MKFTPILLSLNLLFSLTSLSAQSSTEESKGTFLGVSVGSGWSKMATNQADFFTGKFTGTSTKTISIPIEIAIPDKANFQMEPALTEMGFGLLEKTATTNSFSRQKADGRIRYLSIPLSLKAKLPIKSDIDFYYAPGLSLSYAWKSRVISNSKSKTETTAQDSRQVVKVPLDEAPISDRLDFGFHLALGAEKHMDHGKFFLEARYYVGILNLDRNYEVDPNDPDTELPVSRNRHLNLSAGYLYAF